MEFHCLWKCMTMGYLPFKKQTQACARECVCVCVCVWQVELKMCYCNKIKAELRSPSSKASLM